jgi:IS30 family transposase
MSGIKSQVLTITYDNGKEFADHELMAKALETDIILPTPMLLGSEESMKIQMV